MIRTVKPPEVRRAELLDTAERIFRLRGYAASTVEEIVREADVAKGTFYHYFTTKEEVLEALATRMVEGMAKGLSRIVSDQSLAPMDKLQRMFAKMQQAGAASRGVVDDLHRNGNRALHERNNVEIVRVLGPLFADVIEEGKLAGTFNVDDAVSTVQFIMAGSLFLFGEGIFNWTARERAARVKAMKVLIRRALQIRNMAGT